MSLRKTQKSVEIAIKTVADCIPIELDHQLQHGHKLTYLAGSLSAQYKVSHLCKPTFINALESMRKLSVAFENMKHKTLSTYTPYAILNKASKKKLENIALKKNEDSLSASLRYFNYYYGYDIFTHPSEKYTIIDAAKGLLYSKYITNILKDVMAYHCYDFYFDENFDDNSSICYGQAPTPPPTPTLYLKRIKWLGCFQEHEGTLSTRTTWRGLKHHLQLSPKQQNSQDDWDEEDSVIEPNCDNDAGKKLQYNTLQNITPEKSSSSNLDDWSDEELLTTYRSTLQEKNYFPFDQEEFNDEDETEDDTDKEQSEEAETEDDSDKEQSEEQLNSGVHQVFRNNRQNYLIVCGFLLEAEIDLNASNTSTIMKSHCAAIWAAQQGVEKILRALLKTFGSSTWKCKGHNLIYFAKALESASPTDISSEEMKIYQKNYLLPIKELAITLENLGEEEWSGFKDKKDLSVRVRYCNQEENTTQAWDSSPVNVFSHIHSIKGNEIIQDVASLADEAISNYFNTIQL
jgi:HEPN domain-containing protein